MNSESNQAQQNIQLPNTGLRSRFHPCLCHLLCHAPTFWFRRQTEGQHFHKPSWPGLRCRTPPPVLKPTPLTCSYTVTHKPEYTYYDTQILCHTQWIHTLNAFAHRDVSQLSLQSREAPQRYCIQTEKKIHLELRKENNAACDMWHKTSWEFDSRHENRGCYFNLHCFVNILLFYRALLRKQIYNNTTQLWWTELTF